MSNELSKDPMKELANFLKAEPATLKNVLKKTAFKNCLTDEDFMAAVMTANAYKLNPILKQIHAFAAKGGGVVPVVSVDGWVHIVNSQPNYDGMEQIENRDEKGNVISITTKMYHKDRKYPTIANEYMAECKNEANNTWQKWPIRMLNHKSYIQCARKAFGISGIYDEDEAERIRESIDVTPGKPDVDVPQAKSKTADTSVEEKQKEEPAVEEKKEPKKQKEVEEPKAEYSSLQDVLNLKKESSPLSKVKCFIKSVGKTKSKSGKTIAIIQTIDSYSNKSPIGAEIRMFTDNDFVAGVEHVFDNVRSAGVFNGKTVYAADTATEANDDGIEI